jgi:hypothetical protein
VHRVNGKTAARRAPFDNAGGTLSVVSKCMPTEDAEDDRDKVVRVRKCMRGQGREMSRL